MASSTISGMVDESTHTISLSVPFGTDVQSLTPEVLVSPLATSSPSSLVTQDFTNPVTYTVVAEDGSTQEYIVTVVVDADTNPQPPVVLSTEKAIVGLSVLVASSTISSVIDEPAHTITLTVPFGTEITTLEPVIDVSPSASSTPASLAPQDFTTPVTYTITAEDGSTQEYVVTVIVEPAPLLPEISSYTFNSLEADITADFATTTPLVELVLTANKNVDWVSVTIENQTDPTQNKRFFSGTGCVDGTTTCSKIWDGVLSGATSTAPNGTYQIKAHIKDSDTNDFNEYLSPYIIVVQK